MIAARKRTWRVKKEASERQLVPQRGAAVKKQSVVDVKLWWAYNPVEQFAAIDKLEHHVNLRLASSNLE
jgi:hypothetical protein